MTLLIEYQAIAITLVESPAVPESGVQVVLRSTAFSVSSMSGEMHPVHPSIRRCNTIPS